MVFKFNQQNIFERFASSGSRSTSQQQGWNSHHMTQGKRSFVRPWFRLVLLSADASYTPKRQDTMPRIYALNLVLKVVIATAEIITRWNAKCGWMAIDWAISALLTIGNTYKGNRFDDRLKTRMAALNPCWARSPWPWDTQTPSSPSSAWLRWCLQEGHTRGRPTFAPCLSHTSRWPNCPEMKAK